MCVNMIKVLVIFQFCLVFGILAERPSTCGELERKRKTTEDDTENLKLALEEYKLARGEKEDVLEECNEFSTCSLCLREKVNPLCGWCSLHNRCSLEKNCPGKDSGTDVWITSSDKCPKIRAVKPHLLAAFRARMLEIIIPHLPDNEEGFICSFEVLGKTLLTKGRKINRGITCASPHPDRIPRIPADTDHMPVTFSVRTPRRPNIATTSNFTIYECGRINSCTECASSPFPCAWCALGDRCTHDVDENCRNDIIVFSKSVTRPTLRQGSSYCSKILPNTGHSSNEILVPSGTKWRITVRVENMMQFQVISRFACKVSGFPRVTAQLLGDNIYCGEMNLKVLNRQPVSNLSLSVFWSNGERKMDNPENLHVVVFHCGLMASSCGECLDLPDRYKCGWCEESNTCTVRQKCADGAWMNNKQTCTQPQITSFYPKSGLLTKQANITIKGINFAKEFKDIEGITLIDEESETISECIPFEDLFVRHSQIVCLLNIPEVPEENNRTLRGIFELKFSNDIVTISEEEYSFVDPSITKFDPVKGMFSGGTLLKITGHNLDAGNKVEAFIGDIPCSIISRDSSSLRCITSPVQGTNESPPSPVSRAVRVVFDGEEKTSSVYFFYMPNPHILSVKSESFTEGPVGTLSGGNLIVVEGENFDLVPNPYFNVVIDGTEYPGPCTVASDTRMECLTPRIPSEVVNFCGEEGSLVFDYGFKMGGVRGVQNISLNVGNAKYHLYPDPYFMPFTEEGRVKLCKSDYLVIKGRYLDSVFNENDITVLIGTEECIVTSLSHTQLICRPPDVQPDVKDGDDENKLPEVMVRLRSTHEYFIGFLRYDKE